MVSANAAGNSAPAERHQIVLFGGHGSPTIFSPVAARRAKTDAKDSAPGAILLSRCHAAFLEECLGLEDTSRRKLGLDLTNFQSPKSFLVPSESLQKNPIIQATTICLYQLLRYTAEVDSPGSRLEVSGKQVLETVGVCSGLLPAAVIATSATIPELIDHGVASFRLAFRIACRSAIYGHGYEGGTDRIGSWALIIIGLNQRQAEEQVKNFCVQVSEEAQKYLPSAWAAISDCSGQTATNPIICYPNGQYDFRDGPERRVGLFPGMVRPKSDGQICRRGCLVPRRRST